MAFVYILKSIRDKRYYISSTVDLDARFKHHKAGYTPSTKRFGGVELVLTQEYNTIAEARSMERKLKKLKRRDYLDKIVKDGFIKIRL